MGTEGDKPTEPNRLTLQLDKPSTIFVKNNPIVNLKKAVKDRDSGGVNPELLKKSNRLSKNPEEYEMLLSNMKRITKKDIL